MVLSSDPLNPYAAPLGESMPLERQRLSNSIPLFAKVVLIIDLGLSSLALARGFVGTAAYVQLIGIDRPNKWLLLTVAITLTATGMFALPGNILALLRKRSALYLCISAALATTASAAFNTWRVYLVTGNTTYVVLALVIQVVGVVAYIAAIVQWWHWLKTRAANQ